MKNFSFEEYVIDWRTGLNPRRNFKLGFGKNNYVTIKDIHNGHIVITDKTDKVDDNAIRLIEKRSRIKNGDILFSSIGRIGDTAIVKNKDHTWDVNESVFVFTVNPCVITPDFFCLIFKSNKVKDFLQRNSTGTTFPSIKMNQLKKLKLHLPNLAEQNAIVDEIDSFIGAIENRKMILGTLDSLVKSRFVEVVGRFPKTKIIKEYVEPKIKRVKVAYSENDLINYVDISSIDNDSRSVSTATPFVVSKAPSRAQQCIETGDVLVSTVRPNLKNIGINKLRIANMVGSTGFCVLRPRDCTSEFLLECVLSDDFTQAMINCQTGIGYPAVRDSDVLNYVTFDVPRNVILDFTEFAKEIDKSKFVGHSRYFLCDNLTFSSSTIAYSRVVSIFECPKRCCTCSIGIPLSIALVAMVLRNLCGWTLLIPIFLPIFLNIISTPLISRRL